MREEDEPSGLMAELIFNRGDKLTEETSFGGSEIQRDAVGALDAGSSDDEYVGEEDGPAGLMAELIVNRDDDDDAAAAEPAIGSSWKASMVVFYVLYEAVNIITMARAKDESGDTNFDVPVSV